MKKKEKKKKPSQYLPSELNTKMLNYCVYVMKPMEKIVYLLALTLIGGCVCMVFYANLFMKDGEATMATHISNFIVFFGGGVLAAIKFIPIVEAHLCDKRKNVLKLQFREMLAALATAFSAGENLLGAFQSAKKEMDLQFGPASYISKETDEILAGMNSNISIQRLLGNFAARSGLEDIDNFSDIISICYQKGGNMKSVVRNTYDLIGDKITISEEIKTKLTSNKLQQQVMSVIPIFLIGYLRVSSSSFAESFASFTGVITMTIAVGIFVGAYIYGRKILDIKG